MSLESKFHTEGKPPQKLSPVVGPAMFMLKFLIVWPLYLAVTTWLIVSNVTAITDGGVTFWPVLGLLVAFLLTAGVVKNK